MLTTPALAPSVTPMSDERAALDFIFGLRSYWAWELYPRLRRQYDTRVAGAGSAGPCTPEDALPVIEDLPLAPWFGWCERNVQKMKWRHLTDLVERRRAELEAALNAPLASTLGSLELDPSLELPDYYREIEFHLQPGGVWSDDLNAVAYELAARVTMLGYNDDGGIHRLFTDTALPEGRAFRHILDLGCGFGKSTLPFAMRYPDAEVVGIDLSAPNLKLAHRKAEAAGKAVRYSQRTCEATGYADASFDLVTATMLIHELPADALHRTIREAGRLLGPGGVLAILDFQHTGDSFRDAVMDAHGRRNNEPLMPMLFRTDMRRLCDAAGLRDAGWHAFDERGRGMLPERDRGDRPEWHFPWAVLLAEKA